MLLESVIRKAALPADPHANNCEYVFDTTGHAYLGLDIHPSFSPLAQVFNPDNSGLVYGPDDKLLAQRFQEFLDADFSQEIRQISMIFTETNLKLHHPSHLNDWMQYSKPFQPFFCILAGYRHTPPTTLSFLHNPTFVSKFHNLTLSFLEANPGPSGYKFRPSSIFPHPFTLSSIKDPNCNYLLRTLLTTLCTFAPASSIPMTFRLAPPSVLQDLKDTLHRSPFSHRKPRPFLVPLSEPQQLDDGTIYLKILGNVMPLSEFTNFLVSGRIPVSSQTVIVWCIECILGVESRFNLRLANSPLQPDDIFVDSLFRFLIRGHGVGLCPLPSLPASPKTEQSTYSLSSEIEHVSKYFDELITILSKHHLILVPTINTTDFFHTLRLSAISSLVETTHLPSVILEDLNFFPSIQSPSPNHLPSQRLQPPDQWISVIVRELKDWYRGKLNSDFDKDLLKDSLSQVISQLLSKYRPLFDNSERSHWDGFRDTLARRATGGRKEPDTMFLADDIYKPARSSILTESQIYFYYLREIDRFVSDPTIPRSSEDQNSEAKTASFHAEVISYSSDFHAAPRWERDSHGQKFSVFLSRNTER
ncbi:hypothetical protein BLNAU_1069 [Blattamonas nauphoetae]|uniref:Uncharacterized protein n=1 Tax=Blattamonas nauphoetae TaxID=2049346 RepID=A0ABQ9YJR8_9EUKA|nr:hypothetical protein BLNAU_1069 [Blattamonas nauphoetae]